MDAAELVAPWADEVENCPVISVGRVDVTIIVTDAVTGCSEVVVVVVDDFINCVVSEEGS